MNRRETPRHPPALAGRLVLPLVAALLLGALALSACSTDRTVPSEAAGITGAVVTIVDGDGRPASFLVEGPTPQPTGAVSDKANVSIPTSTQFFDASGKPATLDAIGAISKGTRVKVWFLGAVAESYPVQGSAKAVQILGN
jgi:hypothetical protein